MDRRIILACFVLGFTLYTMYRRNREPKVYVVNNMLGGYNARTIPPFGIFVNKSQKDNQALLQHERIHWKQFQDRGLVMFYVDYLAGLRNHGYDRHPMEIEARANESEHCKLNYTECVRNGTARTLYDPDFRS